MRFGPFVRGQGELKRAGGADVLDVPVAPGAALPLLGCLVNNAARADRKNTLCACDAAEQLYGYLPQRLDLLVGYRCHESLVKPVLQQCVRLAEALPGREDELVLLVDAQPPLLIFVGYE